MGPDGCVLHAVMVSNTHPLVMQNPLCIRTNSGTWVHGTFILALYLDINPIHYILLNKQMNSSPINRHSQCL
ncbi:hypothetical protein XELAEV_18039814mg [Xenopus laevis]|uniref:Uncharacterized protein n=1 Tax=Xenopus laevis TaxID=8355 RepID=A0A974C8F9_XENLA|nr:hypothetical protein XELAEV_18039814mg [Xenopus laevis]